MPPEKVETITSAPLSGSRRGFLGSLVVASAGAGLAHVATAETVDSGPQPARGAEPASVSAQPVSLDINGRVHSLSIEPRVTLLDALRDYIGLTGTKKGCDRGQCGACTVLIDGRRVNACLTLAIMQQGRRIVTVEGLAQGDALAPLQAAFVRRDAFQCGYCTPGQLCSATALLGELRDGQPSATTADVRKAGPIAASDEEIRERMSGNLCRCGAYPNIVAAITDASRSVGVA